jgi:hypothetical protein
LFAAATVKKRGEESIMKKVLLICLALSLVLFFVVLASAADKETVNGWVADSKCGVKGAAEGQEACTKKCIEAGAKMVVVTDKDQKILTVENPEALKGHEGHHVAVTGHVSKESIHVETVKML